MSGVWIFDRRGVARLIAHPTRESFEQRSDHHHNQHHQGTATAPGARPRVLVHLPTNQVIRSYEQLEQRLGELGWTRYWSSNSDKNHEDSGLVQFHRSDSSAHLISLPKSFASLKPFHMYDIVVKNRSVFEVRDVPC